MMKQTIPPSRLRASHRFCTAAISQPVDVRVSGALRNVMMKGGLQATINLDTIRNKEHLYGIVPLEYLRGEILIIDGMAYKAVVKPDAVLGVEKTFDLKAPFFVYANIKSWKEYTLPDSVHTLLQLDNFLSQRTFRKGKPFAFRLLGKVIKAEIRVVNLPVNATVKSPEDARLGLRDYMLAGETVEMIGFYSTQHRGIFTHHDSNMHIHLITSDKTRMGHLSSVYLDKNIKLYLPE